MSESIVTQSLEAIDSSLVEIDAFLNYTTPSLGRIFLVIANLTVLSGSILDGTGVIKKIDTSLKELVKVAETLGGLIPDVGPAIRQIAKIIKDTNIIQEFGRVLDQMNKLAEKVESSL